jgi:hypothetical protein
MDLVTGLLVAMAVFVSGLAGLFLFRWLPDNHLTNETRDYVRLGMNMISIVAALVLGLLIASAKGTTERADQRLRSYAADITQFDQIMRNYGPAGDAIRAELLRYTATAVATTWPDSGLAGNTELESVDEGRMLERAMQGILALDPQTDQQRWLRNQALDLMNGIIHTRWLLLIDQRGTISPVLLLIVVIWIAFIFASFGLNAPRNATVVAALLVCSLSVGTAIFVILDMDHPFDGAIIVSGGPMKNALAHLRAPG